MWVAAGWGLVGGSALLVGALLGLFVPVSQRVIGFVMAFGAGVLISALSFELTGEAVERAGIATAAAGLLGGGLAFFAAVFLSNTPEALSAASGMRLAGYSRGAILGLWGGIVIASGLAALLDHVLLDGADAHLIAFILAFAAGAIRTMLADTMMPEAFEHGGNLVGLVTLVGFAAALMLSAI